MSPVREDTDCLRAFLGRMPPRGQSIVASAAAAGWDDITGIILDGPIEDFSDFAASFSIVVFFLRGSAQLDWRRENRFSRLMVKAGDVLVAPPADCHRMRVIPGVEMLCCPIDPGRLDELARREWAAAGRGFRIIEGLERGDEDLWNLGRRLADRILAPIPGARSYAGAIQTQIAVRLLWSHSSLGRPGRDANGVADPRLGPVIAYIRENLNDDVSLETLAGVAGLSPNYFLGAFREATGRTPHRYVTELRVARACELLRDPHRPITEVSLAVGFSSQSHLTEVFRRTMKTTPAAYRRDALGLAPSVDGPDP